MTKIRAELGPIKGAYENKGRVPITAKPCEHVVLFKDGTPLRGGGGSTRVVTFHGTADGESKITSEEV